jgi:hypothetical protein
MSRPAPAIDEQLAVSHNAPSPALNWRKLFVRLQLPIGVLLTIFALVIGWVGRDTRGLTADSGLGYWLGIVGGSLMVALLMYSVRKRIPLLRRLGATRHWFKWHMNLGIIGPVIILYHSNFDFLAGGINSQVALYCTLLVAASGVVGRYFYAQIHNGLYGSSASLRQLVKAVEEAEETETHSPGLTGAVRTELAALAQQVLKKPESLGASAMWPAWFGIKTRWVSWQLRRVAYRNIDELANNSAVAREHRSRLRRASRRYLSKRLAEIRRVAQFNFFEKLFSLWHVIHVPFFIMMVLTAIFHVIAVHMY